jgi:phosphoglycolate phosphatase-like HAD superfamily hydrolase
MYVCLFDIDGTLLASGGAGKAAMEAALVSEFGVTDVNHDVPFSGRTDRAIGRDLLRLHGLAQTEENWQRFLAGYLGNLPGYLSSHNGRVLPGITVLLERLAIHDEVAVGLLTGNVREGARLKLGHYGLYHHFGFGGFGDHYLDRDDVAREALEVVRQKFGDQIDLDRIWVIGDTPLDVQCARCIGVRVAAVGTGWHSLEELEAAEPDLILADFTDPQPLFDSWEKGDH